MGEHFLGTLPLQIRDILPSDDAGKFLHSPLVVQLFHTGIGLPVLNLFGNFHVGICI